MACDLSNVAFIDCETTGLDPTRHVPWEIAIIIDDQEYSWILMLTEAELAAAEPMALKIGGWYTRAGELSYPQSAQSASKVQHKVQYFERQALADRIVKLIGERHIVGAVPSFDDRFVGDFCRLWVRPPIWHYHLVDIEAMAAGALRQEPPWKSNDLSRAVGVDPEQFDRHTALGDARWNKAVYTKILEDAAVYGTLPTSAHG